MYILRNISALTLVMICTPAAEMSGGDARRGEQLLETQQCLRCHSINGRGGTIAPDLARRVDRDYSPAGMTSLLWNHAPNMWSAMKKYGVPREEMTPDKAADLFAYFVAQRYFEKPGDAGRGKLIFTTRHCTECHGTTSSPNPAAPPVAKWDSLADPAVLAQQMWDHGPQMRAEFARKGITWPILSGQDLSDMLVYLQNLPQTRHLAENFELAASDSGENLFRTEGCADCHKGALNLSTLLKNQTLTQIAADMWDHQPAMKAQPAVLSQEEMRRILGYIWAGQYFRGDGNGTRGRKVFEQKGCASCHNDPKSGAPILSRGKDGFSDITMVSALWSHGPRMLELMQQRGIAWPRFTAPQMTDLIAYLNSLP